MRVALAAVVAGLALVAAGCGSDDTSSSTATEDWANGLCTSLTTWTDSVQSAASTFQDTSSLSADSIQSAVDEVVTATSTLASEVEDLGRPDTEAGQQAEETVSGLADTLQQDADTLKDAFDSASDGGLTELLAAIPTITTTASSMAGAVKQAFDELQGMDAKGELETAFENADSCAGISGS